MEKRKEAYRQCGILIYALMTILITLGICNLHTYGLALVIISGLLIYLFIRYEKKKENPIFKVSLLKNTRFMMKLCRKRYILCDFNIHCSGILSPIVYYGYACTFCRSYDAYNTCHYDIHISYGRKAYCKI